jgi:hypothetical protein
MPGEHTGPGRPIASGQEHLHLPGGPWQQPFKVTRHQHANHYNPLWIGVHCFMYLSFLHIRLVTLCNYFLGTNPIFVKNILRFGAMFPASYIGQQRLVDTASKPISFYHLSVIFRRLFAETRRLSQAENNPSLCTTPFKGTVAWDGFQA